MLPGTVVSVVALILIVGPGAVLESLRQRTRAQRTESAFLEASRVLVGGVLLSTATLLLLEVCAIIFPDALLNARNALLVPTYLAENVGLTLWSTASFSAISSTLAALYFSLTPTLGRNTVALPESAWINIFSGLESYIRRRESESAGDEVIVTQLQVGLDDGRTFIGVKESFSSSIEIGQREMVLRPPLAELIDGRVTPLEGWQRIIIADKSINSILVRFAHSSSGEPSHRLSAVARWLADIRTRASAMLTLPSSLCAILVIELTISLWVGNLLSQGG